jgi:ribosomal protein L29
MAEAKSEGEKAAKNKKINKMTAAEVEAKLDELKTSQGGLCSRYAVRLQLRKKALGR